MWEELFSKAKTEVQTGLGRLVQAKVTEQVERIERKADPLADAVRGMTVSPVNDAPVRQAAPVDTIEGIPTWQKGALVVLGVLVAGALLRRMG